MADQDRDRKRLPLSREDARLLMQSVSAGVAEGLAAGGRAVGQTPSEAFLAGRDHERRLVVAHLRARNAAYASDRTRVSGEAALEMAVEDLERGVHRG